MFYEKVLEVTLWWDTGVINKGGPSGSSAKPSIYWAVIQLGNSLILTAIISVFACASIEKRVDGGGSIAFQRILYPRFQCVNPERFGKVVIGTQIKTPDRTIAGVPGAEHHNGNLGPLPELQTYPDTIKRWHDDVQNNELRLLGIEHVFKIDTGTLGINYFIFTVVEFFL